MKTSTILWIVAAFVAYEFFKGNTATYATSTTCPTGWTYGGPSSIAPGYCINNSTGAVMAQAV